MAPHLPMMTPGRSFMGKLKPATPAAAGKASFRQRVLYWLTKCKKRNRESPPTLSTAACWNVMFSKLHNIPQDIFLEIVDCLPDSSIEALRLTCRDFHQIIRSRSVYDNPSPCEVAAFRYLMRKDTYRAQCEKERDGRLQEGYLLCSKCLYAHKGEAFSPMESAKGPENRICLGLTGLFRPRTGRTLTWAQMDAVYVPLGIESGNPRHFCLAGDHHCLRNRRSRCPDHIFRYGPHDMAHTTWDLLVWVPSMNWEQIQRDSEVIDLVEEVLKDRDIEVCSHYRTSSITRPTIDSIFAGPEPDCRVGVHWPSGMECLRRSPDICAAEMGISIMRCPQYTPPRTAIIFVVERFFRTSDDPSSVNWTSMLEQPPATFFGLPI